MLTSRVLEWWRRSGADLPYGDPRPSHGALMEGYFWRFTDVARGRVAVVLCGVNRHPGGDWATVAVAAHPGHVVVHDAVDGASAAADRFEVRAGDVLRADASGVDVQLPGVRLTARIDDPVGWPRRALHGSGLVSVLPFLGQYWHPHVFDGRVSGTLTIGDETRVLDGATPYAEKNWGAGFPDRWWWGQAHGFERPDVCVAFAGGHLTALGGRVGTDLGGVVVRLGDEVVRLTPPTARVRTGQRAGRWTVDARSPRWRVRVDGDGAAGTPHRLPVPLVDERRNVMSDLEHQAGRLSLEVWYRGRLHYAGTTTLAALEVGTLDPARTDELLADAVTP